MGTDEAKWVTPMVVDDITFAFPVHVKKFMPEYGEIPADFRNLNSIGKSGPAKWIRFQMDWFGSGFEKLDLAPREGVDPKLAIRHLAIIQKSFEPKHEHKVAAVAYLASLWFEDVVYQTKKDKAF